MRSLSREKDTARQVIKVGLRRHGLVPRPPEIRAVLAESALRFSEGNRVEIFSHGRIALSAMLDAVAAARRRVHLETYILRSDATGQRFLAALAERARAGVAVRLLYDAFGSRSMSGEVLAPLREAGADIVAFNPLRRFYPHWAPRRRDHRKLLIVDGSVAFTGGLNIGDEYWGEAEHDAPATDGWRDTQLSLMGPVLQDLEAVFLESWFRAGGPDLPWHEVLTPARERAGEVRCAVVPDGPVYHRRRMRDLLLAGLASAEKSVWLASPYFVPGSRVLEALTAAGRRGVQIDLVLTGARTDHPVLRRIARRFVPLLCECGVRVYEYQHAMLHAKVALFDERWAIVGSSNLDRQSFEHSYEVNLLLEGQEVTVPLYQMFEADIAASQRVDPVFLAERSLWDRFCDRLAGLLLCAL